MARKNEPKTSTIRIPVREVERAKRQHRLELISGPGAPRRIRLYGGSIVIGRSTTADVRIETSELSRTHLSITDVDGEFVAKDLDSRNGVYLNGVKIYSATLKDGDQLQVGGVVIVYHEGD